MTFSIEEMLLIISGVFALLCYATYLGNRHGKLEARVLNNEADIQGLADRFCNELHEIKLELKKDFSAISEAKNETLHEMMKGCLDSRNLIIMENAKEHKIFFESMNSINDRLSMLEKVK